MSGSPSPIRKNRKHRQRQQELSLADAHSESIPSARSAASEFSERAHRNEKVLAAPAVIEQQRTTPELERRVEQLEQQLRRRLQEVESRLGELDDVQRRLKELEAHRPAQPDSEEKPEVVEESTFERVKREGSEHLEDIEVAGGDPLALEQVSLEGTVWDCLLLVTLRGPRGLLLSPVQIFCVLVLGLANAILQSLCVYGIADYMIQDPLSEDMRGAILYERLSRNHQKNDIDAQTLLTRTSMLCEGKIYDSHWLLYDDVSNYLRLFPFWEFRAGEIISLLAMLFWSLTMSQEMQRIYQLGRTVCNLRRLSDDSAWANVVINKDSDGYDIVRMATIVKLPFLFLVLLPRAVLGLLLLQCGLRWLAATVNVSDLILNACALEIVKGLDEALFAAVLIGVVKVECFQFEPQTVAPRSRASKLTGQCVMFLAPTILVAGMLGWAHASYLSKFVEKVQSVDNYLCGEDRDFVWVEQGITGLPVFAAAQSSQEDAQWRCVYATAIDLIAIRAGFPPQWAQASDTLRAQVLGTHESCSVNGTGGPMKISCPSVDFSELDAIHDLSPETFLAPSSGSCRDQVVQMRVLHDVCTHSDFDGAASTIFNGRAECKDMEPVCHCRRREYDKNEFVYFCNMWDLYAEVAQTYNVTVDWIVQIQFLCPETCNMCQRWWWESEEEESASSSPSLGDGGPESVDGSGGGSHPNNGSGATTASAEFESQGGPDSVDGATTSAAESDLQTT